MVNNKMIVTFMLIAMVTLAGAGCSDENPVTPTNTVDTAPPAVPTNLSVNYASDLAVISWDRSTVDLDLAGYIVTRENGGITETLIAVPALITSYEDTNPPTGMSQYHVYAVDFAGNMSAVATVNLSITLSHQVYDLSH